jgi:hypothetical protein
MTIYKSRIITVSIDRDWREVYDFASIPENFQRWAAGLGRRFERSGEEWREQLRSNLLQLALVRARSQMGSRHCSSGWTPERQARRSRYANWWKLLEAAWFRESPTPHRMTVPVGVAPEPEMSEAAGIFGKGQGGRRTWQRAAKEQCK